MNKEDPYRDQAEKLRQKIERQSEQQKELPYTNETGAMPKRSDLHRHKRKKTKWKLKFSLIRLLVLIFVPLPLVIYSGYTYLEGKKLTDSNKSSDTIETINFEKDQSNSKAVKNKDKNDQNSNKTSKEKQQTASNSPTETKTSNEEKQTDTKSSESSNSNTQETPADQQSTEQKEVIYHTVQPNETLFRIAIKYYQSKSGVEKIKEANQLQTDNIYVGQVLKIPQ